VRFSYVIPSLFNSAKCFLKGFLWHLYWIKQNLQYLTLLAYFWCHFRLCSLYFKLLFSFFGCPILFICLKFSLFWFNSLSSFYFFFVLGTLFACAVASFRISLSWVLCFIFICPGFVSSLSFFDIFTSLLFYFGKFFHPSFVFSPCFLLFIVSRSLYITYAVAFIYFIRFLAFATAFNFLSLIVLLFVVVLVLKCSFLSFLRIAVSEYSFYDFFCHLCVIA
jgi:hypothetical protein